MNKHDSFHSVFVILIGESAVGKTTIIKALQKKDPRFVMIQLTTDRASRINEDEDRDCIEEEEFTRLEENRELLPVIGKHGNRYAIKIKALQAALDTYKIPIVDYTFEGLSGLRKFKDLIFPIYIMPPSLSILKVRLKNLGRDPDGKRFETARLEIQKIQEKNFYPSSIHGGVVVNKNLDTTVKEIREKIYTRISGS